MQGGVFVPRRDAHETDNRKTIVAQAFLDKRICVSRHYAGFLWLLASVYLDKQFGTPIFPFMHSDRKIRQTLVYFEPGVWDVLFEATRV